MRQIPQPYLNSAGIVEPVDKGEDSVAGVMPGAEGNRMHGFLFEDGEKAFAPGVVTGFADAGEALAETEVCQVVYDNAGRELASPVGVKNGSGRKPPLFPHAANRIKHQRVGHAIRLLVCKNHAAFDIANGTQVIKSFRRGDIADITGEGLKRCSLLTSLASAPPALCSLVCCAHRIAWSFERCYAPIAR